MLKIFASLACVKSIPIKLHNGYLFLTLSREFQEIEFYSWAEMLGEFVHRKNEAVNCVLEIVDAGDLRSFSDVVGS
jgi:hypothetical protein